MLTSCRSFSQIVHFTCLILIKSSWDELGAYRKVNDNPMLITRPFWIKKSTFFLNTQDIAWVLYW